MSGVALAVLLAAVPLWPQPAAVDAPGLSREAIEKGLPDPVQREQFEKAVDRRDYGGAETLLGRELERTPYSANLLKLIASLSFVEGKYANTAIALKKAEKIAPLDWHSRFTLALAYVVLKRPDWARPELAKLAAEFPHNPVYVYWQGRLDYDAQLFPAAAEKFHKAVEIQPEFMRAYDNLGLCYEAMGRMDDAVKTYADAMSLNRKLAKPSPWPPLNAGTLLLKLGRLDEAERALRESVGLQPAFPQARYQLGVLLEKRGDNQAAVAELRKAAELDDSYPEPLYALGRVYRRLGRRDQAAEALQRFQALHARKRAAK